MSLVFWVLFSIFAYHIFVCSGVNKLLWFYSAILLLHDGAFGPWCFYAFFSIVYLASLYYHGDFKDYWETFPLKVTLIYIFIIFLLIGFLDSRISYVSGLSRALRTFFTTFFYIFIGYTSIRRYEDVDKFSDCLSKVLFFVSIYGILCVLLKYNYLYNIETEALTGSVGMWAQMSWRGYRCCSTFNNVIAYGGVMGMLSIFFLVVWNPYLKVKKYLLVLLLLLNCVFANTRTGLISTAICFFLYYVLSFDFKKISIGIILGFIIFTVILYNIPSIQVIVDSALKLVLYGQSDGGSDIDLKNSQMEISLFLFSQSPLFGNGLGYFNEVISVEMESDSFLKGLAGMEGYGYRMLIEQGLFMIIGFVLFFVEVIIMCFKLRTSKDYSSLCVAVVLSFIFFILSTGEYGGVFAYNLLIIGLLLRSLYLNKNNNVYE